MGVPTPGRTLKLTSTPSREAKGAMERLDAAGVIPWGEWTALRAEPTRAAKLSLGETGICTAGAAARGRAWILGSAAKGLASNASRARARRVDICPPGSDLKFGASLTGSTRRYAGCRGKTPISPRG